MTKAQKYPNVVYGYVNDEGEFTAFAKSEFDVVDMDGEYGEYQLKRIVEITVEPSVVVRPVKGGKK